MGATLCSSGHQSPRTFRRQEVFEDQHVGLRASIYKIIRPRFLWGAKKKKKRQHEQLDGLLKNNTQVWTLEDWILASPGAELHVSKQFSTKVYPSPPSLTEEEEYGSNQRALGLIFSAERVVEDYNADEVSRELVEISSSSLRRSTSGKTKKKVTFRLPGMADILTLESPGVIYGL